MQRHSYIYLQSKLESCKIDYKLTQNPKNTYIQHTFVNIHKHISHTLHYKQRTITILLYFQMVTYLKNNYRCNKLLYIKLNFPYYLRFFFTSGVTFILKYHTVPTTIIKVTRRISSACDSVLFQPNYG